MPLTCAVLVRFCRSCSLRCIGASESLTVCTAAVGRRWPVHWQGRTLLDWQMRPARHLSRYHPFPSFCLQDSNVWAWGYVGEGPDFVRPPLYSAWGHSTSGDCGGKTTKGPSHHIVCQCAHVSVPQPPQWWCSTSSCTNRACRTLVWAASSPPTWGVWRAKGWSGERSWESCASRPPGGTHSGTVSCRGGEASTQLRVQ